MASPAEAAAPSFSQVTFTDTPHSYPPATPITCTYTLCPTFQPHSRDWVGIFKVGWSATKDYYTFVWVEQSQDVSGQQDVIRQVAFKEYYLPKDHLDFYQFCYVDNSGQVRGASTPFCFRNPTEQSGEGSLEEDLLVITTQEQVDQSVREKAELQRALQRERAENKSFQNALQGEQQQTCMLKEEIEKKDKELSEVVEELHRAQEEVKNTESALQQQRQENQRLKDQMIQRNPRQQKQQDQRLTTDRHKEQKEELDGLRRTVDALSDEIATLNAAVRAGEQEVSKAKDIAQLLQVDLQSSEKDKERLRAELQSLIQNMEEMEKKNQELVQRLAGAQSEQNPLNEALEDRCQSLLRELEATRTKLQVQREEVKNMEKKGAHLEREFQQVTEQLEKVMKTLEAEQCKSNKYELQLREVVKVIAEKDILMSETETTVLLERREKEELSRENETLRRDNEGLRRSYAELHRVGPNTAAENIPSPPQQRPGQTEELYEAVGSVEERVEERVEEPSLVCCLCQESFPGITAAELELHQQSHRVCPFCSVVCDAMEQTEFEDHVYAHEL